VVTLPKQRGNAPKSSRPTIRLVGTASRSGGIRTSQRDVPTPEMAERARGCSAAKLIPRKFVPLADRYRAEEALVDGHQPRTRMLQRKDRRRESRNHFASSSSPGSGRALAKFCSTADQSNRLVWPAWAPAYETGTRSARFSPARTRQESSSD